MSNSNDRLTNIYKELLPTITKDKFQLVGEFNEDFIDVKCSDCGETSTVPTQLFLDGPTCVNKKCLKRTKTIKSIKSFLGDEYEIIKNFCDLNKKSSGYDKILIRHKSCNKEYTVDLKDTLNIHFCPYCRELDCENIDANEK